MNNRLREIRKEQRYSARQLAEQVGCNIKSIYRIEAGGVPSFGLAKRLEQFFGRTDIFFEDEPPHVDNGGDAA